jgi:hypothetical protein
VTSGTEVSRCNALQITCAQRHLEFRSIPRNNSPAKVTTSEKPFHLFDAADDGERQVARVRRGAHQTNVPGRDPRPTIHRLDQTLSNAPIGADANFGSRNRLRSLRHHPIDIADL